MQVTRQDVEAAAIRLGGSVTRTPLVRAHGLCALTGRDVWLKLETLQRTRSFKYRGALNAVLKIADAGGRRSSTALVTASAGNHGAALAAAASTAGVPLRVFVPDTAPRAKVDRMRLPGVDVVTDCRGYDHAESRALDTARAGATFVSAYNHPDVIAGAGTVGLEVLEQLARPGAIVVPTGGGGLLSGVAMAAGHVTPVVGVEPAVNPAFSLALAAGHVVPFTPGASLADGLLGNLENGSATVDLVRRYAAGVRGVPEDHVRAGVRALFSEDRLVAEGAGAIAVGAVLGDLLADLDDPLVLLITGANIDTAPFIEAISS